MKLQKIINICLLVLFILAYIFFCVAAYASEFNATVLQVTDGDTIKVKKDNEVYKIRLIGIDAPEKKQSYGISSQKNLCNLICIKDVHIKYDKSDKYGRLLGKVTIENVDVSLYQLKSGYAWYYKKYESNLNGWDRIVYSSAELEARKSKLGLWADDAPIAPWNWRIEK